MKVTLLPIVTDFRLLQPLNALSPIVFTCSGIIIWGRFLQPPKARKPIVVNPSGNVTDFRLLQSPNTVYPFCCFYVPLALLSYIIPQNENKAMGQTVFHAQKKTNKISEFELKFSNFHKIHGKRYPDDRHGLKSFQIQL